MNRKHTIEEYLKIVEKLAKVRSDIKFSSDFIIGYPGETYDDFQKTLKLMDKIQFINSFSFIYSARPGTPAFDLSTIDTKDAKNRLIEFQRIAEGIKNSYRKKLINKNVKVLFENKMKDGNKYFGRDEHFNAIIVNSAYDLTGEIKNIKILAGNQNTMFGEVTSNLNQKNNAA